MAYLRGFMKSLKLLIATLVLITNQIGAVTYISEIVNNTNGFLKMEYSVSITDLNVLSCVSLDTNKPIPFEFKGQFCGKVSLVISKHSKVILGKGFYIPDAKYDPKGYLCSGVLLSAKTVGVFQFQPYEIPFALIRQRNSWVELTLRSQYTTSVCDSLFQKISKDNLCDGDTCVLTVNQISDEFYIPSDVGGYKINEQAFEVLVAK